MDPIRSASRPPSAGLRRSTLGACTSSALMAGLFFVAGVAAPAAAHDRANCLWNHLPPSSCDGIVKAYALAGADAISSVAVSNATIRAVARACRGRTSDDRQMRRAGGAIAGAALEHAALAALKADGVRSARLEQAWTTAPKAERSPILQNAISVGPVDPPAARDFFKAMADVAVRAGAPRPVGPSPMNDKPFRTYVDYFLGRAQREAFQEPQSEAPH